MLVARWSAPIAVVVLALVTAPQTVAQSTAAGGVGVGGGILATREALREEMGRLDAKGGQEGASAELIRARLESGDFQAGDRIVMRVEGEPQLSDTFVVTAGPQLELPQVGTVPLQGVLRSELEARLTSHLAQYLRQPVVEARSLIRLLIEGDGIVKPGYYGAAPQEPLVDVINQAGGLAPRANVPDIRIERGTKVIWAPSTLRDAMARGYSVDQLSLRAGDRLWVPNHGDSEHSLRMFVLILSIPLMIYTFTHFGN